MCERPLMCAGEAVRNAGDLWQKVETIFFEYLSSPNSKHKQPKHTHITPKANMSLWKMEHGCMFTLLQQHFRKTSL